MYWEGQGDELEIALIEGRKQLEQETQRRQRRHHERQAAHGFEGASSSSDGEWQQHGERQDEQVEEQNVLVLVRGAVAAQQGKPGDHQARDPGQQSPERRESEEEPAAEAGAVTLREQSD